MSAAGVEPGAVEELRARLTGTVLGPGEDGYEDSRSLWNGAIDRRPALIARCAAVADVIDSLQFAREHELPIAVRGGGHSIPGHSVCDDGLMIDLRMMNAARVDASARTVRAQGGMNWGEFDRETAVHRLAVTGGQISHTGIGGLTLGGGVGWLCRKHGLACDNVLSIDVVTADGEVVVASAQENPELFWGLRGGGGNFGVATAIEYRLHPIGPVLGGGVAYDIADARDVLRFHREWAEQAPDELTTLVNVSHVPEGSTVWPPDVHGRTVLFVGLCYAGDLAEGHRIVQQLRDFGRPLADLVAELPYPVLQSMLDPLAPWGERIYEKASFLRELSDDAIDAFVEFATDLPSPGTTMFLQQLGGAIARQPADDTPFRNRDARFLAIVMAHWQEGEERAPKVDWARRFVAALEPSAMEGVYVNFDSDDTVTRVRATYGPNYERLAALKARYDPTNVFRLNQNVAPAAQGA